ncbi:hypothetical protein D3C85_1082340 [compost metagenome]
MMGLQWASSQAGGISFQLFAKFRMGDLDHETRPLSEAQAAQIGDAMFGDDQTRFATRRADRPAEPRNDATVLASSGGQGDDRQAVTGEASAAQEVDSTTECADVVARGALGIDLAAQVDLNCRVDGHQAILRGEYLRSVGVVGGTHADLRVAVGEAMQLPAAHEYASYNYPLVQGLARVGDDAAAYQVGDAIADGSRVNAQLPVPIEGLQYGFWDCANT